MKFIVKIVISLVVAAVATFAATLLPGITASFLTLFAVLACATIATAALVSVPAPQQHTAPAAKKTPAKRAPKPAANKPAPRAAASDASREHGLVKWFNVSKGFGFITKDDGEEIFVHFRSIRGEGRRGLRDGQEVTFIVAESDKGPQAEDVEGL